MDDQIRFQINRPQIKVTLTDQRRLYWLVSTAGSTFGGTTVPVARMMAGSALRRLAQKIDGLDYPGEE